MLFSVALSCCLEVCTSSAIAQSSTSAKLSGSVTDPSGAIVPHAKITAINTGTGLAVTIQSDGAGNYAFNSLPPGQYTLSTTLDGFAPLTETGIVLTVGQSATLNLPLKLGGSQDAITVNGGAELINTTTAELSQVVDEALLKTFRLTDAIRALWSSSPLASPTN